MPTYLSESFTGTDGTAWSTSNWVTGSNSTGATAVINSNRGRMGTGTSASGRVSRRVNTSTNTYSNLEISGKFELSSGTVYPSIWLRCDANVDTERGYGFLFNRFGDYFITRTPSGYSGTTIGSATKTLNVGTVYGFRFRAIGGSIKARTWDASGAEPTTWDIDVTDGSPLAAGYAGLTVANGAAVNAYTFFDDILVTSGQESVTLTGSITPAGVLKRGTFIKNAFTGSISPVGTWSYIKVVERLFTATIGSSGALIKRTNRVIVGAITPTKTFRKVPIKRLSGTITPSGFYKKAFVRVFTGAIGTVGARVFTLLGRVSGRPGIAAVVLRAAGDAIVRVRRG